MLDFLKGRLRESQAARLAAVDQEAQRQQRAAQVKAMVALLKDLLRDERYAAYAQLLRDTQASLLSEREALLRDETDREAREHQVAVLTGRLMQLEYILTTPDNFLRLAEQLETNGKVLSPPVREPVR